MSGNYTLGGISPDFANFTEAVDALDSLGVSGPVTINIRNGIYNEQVSIPVINGTSAANRVVFQSETGDSSQVVLTFASTSTTSNYTLLLLGADYFTFKKMTIQATDSIFGRAVFLKNQSEHLILEHNVIRGSANPLNSANTKLIYSTVAGNHGLTLRNNHFSFGASVLFLSAATDSVVIESNFFENQRFEVLNLSYCDGVRIDKNRFASNITWPPYATFTGIWLKWCDGRVLIRKNDIRLPRPIEYGIRLDNCNGTATERLEVSNNFISTGGPNSAVRAINVKSCNYNDFYFNSTNLDYKYGTSRAFFQEGTSGSGNLRLKNNIFQATFLPILIQQPSSISESDHNLYFFRGNYYYIAAWSGNHTTLASLQAATHKDSNSVSFQVFYAAQQDLHVCDSALHHAGTPITHITDDIDGQPRDPFAPDIGADEITFGLSTYIGQDTIICDTITLEAKGQASYFVWSTGDMEPSIRVINSGRYILAASNACGAVYDTINIIGGPELPVNFGADTNICAGYTLVLDPEIPGSHYVWSTGDTVQSIVVDSSGTYSLDISYKNCTGSDTIAVLVVAASTPVISYSGPTSFCLGDSVILGSNYSQGNQWYLDGNPIPGGTGDSLKVDNTGLYSLGNDNNACNTLTNDTLIIVFSLPTAKAGPDQLYCQGDSVLLVASAFAGNPPYNFYWPLVGGNDSATWVSPVGQTQFTVIITDGNGCMDTDTMAVTSLPLPNAVAVGDLMICEGDSGQLFGQAGGVSGPISYLWLPGNLSGQSQIVSPATTTVFQLIATDVNGCKGTAYHTMSVNPKPSMAISPDTAICAGDSALLHSTVFGTGPFTYQWLPLNQSTPSIWASPLVSTVYSLLISGQNGCTNQASISVDVHTLPQVDIGPDQAICPGDSILLIPIISGGSSPYFYDWVPGHLMDSVLLAMPIVSGGISLNVSDAYNCKGEDSISVTIQPSPQAGFTFSSNLLNITFLDQSLGNPVSWFWDFGDGATSTQQNPAHIYGQNGSYQICLSVTNDLGCTSIFCDSLNVNTVGLSGYQPSGGLVVYPNPNQGHFIIELEESSNNLELNIFDLSGKRVYQAAYTGLSGKVREEINLEHVASGLYLLKVNTENGVLMHLIRKE
ncbi:MAG: T9SS type A sorting domain-containing protein [Bacteroidia bacterium]|nr:T9SS type A sorting domain-containing protein [Bacteroidia bacterium]